MGKLINIDNGGTLTDIWVLDGDKSYHTKTLTYRKNKRPFHPSPTALDRS